MAFNPYTHINNESVGVPGHLTRRATTLAQPMGVYVAKVTNSIDETYQGHINVELIGHERISRQEDKENPEEMKKFHRVRRLVPFGGYEHKEDGKYSIEFGISTQPPTPGTFVLVAFTGHEQEGFLLGVLPDGGRNTQIPGLPANELINEPGTLGVTHDSGVLHDDTTEKNEHPQFTQIKKQGLSNDSVRGLHSSGGRRESPSNVFGFSTMGGHSFVMDDGTVAPVKDSSISPDSGRQPDLNKIFRMRSKEGATLLFNDTWGIVYLIQQNGNAWMQMDKEGNIDVFSEKSINFHAKEDINMYAGKTFNIDADNIQLRARGDDGMNLETTTGEFNLHSNKVIKLTTDLNMHLRAKPQMRLTADLIDINGPPAKVASKPDVNNLTKNLLVAKSINGVVPEHEPWAGHAEDPYEDKVAVQANINLQRSSGALNDYQLPSPISTNKEKTVDNKPDGNLADGSQVGSKNGIIK